MLNVSIVMIGNCHLVVYSLDCLLELNVNKPYHCIVLSISFYMSVTCKEDYSRCTAFIYICFKYNLKYTNIIIV